MEKYRAVLQEGDVFYDTYDQKDMTLQQFQQFQQRHSNENFTMEIPEIAAVDLDSDGQLEIVLSLRAGENNVFGYEILRCQDDKVYGYSITYRAFQDLRTDGSFYFSGSAFDHGCGILQFNANTYTYAIRASVESYPDESNKIITSYFVDNEPVTEKEYDKAASGLLKVRRVKWYPFNDGSLEQVFIN